MAAEGALLGAGRGLPSLHLFCFGLALSTQGELPGEGTLSWGLYSQGLKESLVTAPPPPTQTAVGDTQTHTGRPTLHSDTHTCYQPLVASSATASPHFLLRANSSKPELQTLTRGHPSLSHSPHPSLHLPHDTLPHPSSLFLFPSPPSQISLPHPFCLFPSLSSFPRSVTCLLSPNSALLPVPTLYFGSIHPAQLPSTTSGATEESH